MNKEAGSKDADGPGGGEEEQGTGEAECGEEAVRLERDSGGAYK